MVWAQRNILGKGPMRGVYICRVVVGFESIIFLLFSLGCKFVIALCKRLTRDWGSQIFHCADKEIVEVETYQFGIEA